MSDQPTDRPRFIEPDPEAMRAKLGRLRQSPILASVDPVCTGCGGLTVCACTTPWTLRKR